MQVWELIAREQIRETLARYNWSGDAGRIDELAATFRTDGVLEIRGLDPLRGRADIAAFLGGLTPNAPADGRRVVRHNLTNVLFTGLSPERARVSSYFTVLTEIGLDHFGRYRDVLVPEGDGWLIEHRKVSTDWASPDSTMARRAGGG
ncbi:hypothetical protein BN971_00886 [Mycobacterium bohemicum DSM 44277]|uniref:SnoaL-like domain-containing protein n=2 Tax=Mycobacterium bohemicum TaxID=56425 RepID=A0A1X1R1X7_MYCBE|nr:nuclear transport factor 2 family protein [Mycobacterium bohemicum]MCV6972097.1 nuclear transport factor 2 family protein [Mycobacterium bohemicum]ORU98176.1 hypothetical protein AWB93_15045 [Mycobacterium bohemicum]CPR06910.1 hypothetical protein BN971_00886 [Mycobacterium bohemicum DSM 44277]